MQRAECPRGAEAAAGCSPLSRMPPRTANRQAPRAEPLAGVGSFMIMARIAVKSFGGCGLVKKSAQLSHVRTKGTMISKDSTMSRQK